MTGEGHLRLWQCWIYSGLTKECSWKFFLCIFVILVELLVRRVVYPDTKCTWKWMLLKSTGEAELVPKDNTCSLWIPTSIKLLWVLLYTGFSESQILLINLFQKMNTYIYVLLRTVRCLLIEEGSQCFTACHHKWHLC